MAGEDPQPRCRPDHSPGSLPQFLYCSESSAPTWISGLICPGLGLRSWSFRRQRLTVRGGWEVPVPGSLWGGAGQDTQNVNLDLALDREQSLASDHPPGGQQAGKMSCAGSWADASLEGSACGQSLESTWKERHMGDLFSSCSSSPSQKADLAPASAPAHPEVPGTGAEASAEASAEVGATPEQCPPLGAATEPQATPRPASAPPSSRSSAGCICTLCRAGPCPSDTCRGSFRAPPEITQAFLECLGFLVLSLGNSSLCLHLHMMIFL